MDELKKVAAESLEGAAPKAKSDAVREEIGAMPAPEVAQHAHAAITNLQQSGNVDLAKELEDLVGAAQQNPDGLKRAVIGFVEAHPETIAQFAPKIAAGIIDKL